MKFNWLAMIFTLSMLVTGPLFAAKYKAPPDIIPTLPKFCWAQYMDNLPDDPEYSITGCGASANHYCPGLVQLKQVEKELNSSRRLGLLSGAKGNMEYTLQHTTNYPDCVLRPQAQLNLERIKFQIELLRWKIPKR